MSLLKEINANATVAWSPIRKRSNLLALGLKGDGGVGFENTGGEFKVVSMDFADASRNMMTLGSIKSPTRFASLAWRDIAKHADTCPYGVVAGGMADGAVTFWNPKAMIDGTPGEANACEIGRVTRHKGTVNAIQFNPHDDSSHLLASGGSDGEVYIMSLEKLSAPAVFTPSGGSLAQGQVNEITSVAWNTQVNYILATGSQNGSVVIWDLKQKKPWCELRDPQRGTVSAIAWNPREGLQIATASGDDQRPVVKLWDLRNSTSTPLAEFHEHSAGVLSLSWCPNDPGLILSCAKDNRTLLWDLFSRKTMYEFPSDNIAAPSLGSDQFFGGGGGQRRFNVQWSPRIPAVASACTLDGKVQVFGLSGSGNAAVRAPKWLRRPAGATFGFGGKLVTISNPREQAPQNADRRRMVHFHRIASEPQLVQEAEGLDRTLESKDFKGHCESKIASATSDKERSVWSFMKILFEKDARQHLLLHLGLDAEKINELNAKFKPKEPQQPTMEPKQALLSQGSFNETGAAAEDVFSSEVGTPIAETPGSPLADLSSISGSLPPLDDTSKRLESVPAPMYTEQSESTLMQALLVGNFEVAVNCCLHYNQLADALLLASCGGPELWDKTQRAFFAHQKRPVMRVVSAIIKNELHSLVEQSELREWRETLAILSTYAKSEEFPSLCDKLATRLEGAGDLHSATLCYMCAVNVEKTVNAWLQESKVEARTRGANYALQVLVEKVSIFSQAVDQPDQSIGPDVMSRFADYASLMAAQGRLDIAARYARYSDISCAILKDRIFHAAPIAGVQPPPFPFEMVRVLDQSQQQAAQTQAQNQAQAQTAAVPAQAGYGRQGYQQANQYGAQAHAVPSGYGSQQQGYAGGFGQQPSSYQGQQQQAGYAAPSMQQTGTFRNQPTPGYGAAAPHPGYCLQPQAGGFGAQPQQPGGYGAQPQAAPGYPRQGSFSGPSATPTPPSAGIPTGPGSGSGYGRAQSSGGFPGAPTPAGGASYGAPAAGGYQAAPGGTSGYGATAQVPQVPQASGVNPLAAASTNLASARVSKPGVDMASQKKDGFVSSVGNKELTLKYGNATTAVLSPMAGPAQPTTAQPTVVPGSTENVSQQDMPIVNCLNDLVGSLSSLPLTIIEQKQLPEIQKAKEVLFTKLNAGELSPAVVASLHEMINWFNQRNWAAAQNIYVALTASDWAQHKDWLRGFKALIHFAMKKLR